MFRFAGFPLHQAADDSDLSDEATVAKLEPLLQEGTDEINQTAERDNWTLLYVAAYKRKTATVHLLLSHGADPNIQNAYGETALHGAALRHGDAAMVLELLEHGADPAIVNKDGRTARDLAVGNGHGEVARLLEEAAKVEAWMDNLDNEEKAKELLEQIKDKDVAMYYVAWARREEEVILAAVDRLLDAGANTTYKFGGKSALDEALKQKFDNVVAALVKAGSDTEITHTFCKLAEVHSHEAVKLLLKNVRLIKPNWNVNAMDENGLTALHHAVLGDEGGEEATLDTLNVLLEQSDIDTNVKNSRGKTALDLAVEKGEKEVIGIILLTRTKSLEPLNEIIRSSDTAKIKENYADIWTEAMSSHSSQEKVKVALKETNLDELNVAFNDIDVIAQKKLFYDCKVHLDTENDKTLLQHLAEKGDEISRQREDFVSMLARIDQYRIDQGEEDRDGAAGRVVAQLKESLESSRYLVTWIQSAKRKFPISKTKMWLQILVAFLLMVYRLGSYLGDVGTDGWVTHKLHNFSTLPDSAFSPANMTALDLQVIEQCNNSSQLNFVDFAHCYEDKIHANHQFEHNQFRPEEWNLLYILSLVHMLLSWPLFWFLAVYLSKSHQTVLEVLFFPISTYIKQFYQNVQLSKALHEDEENKNKKDEITQKFKTLEEKETLVATIEVSTESSFQFYLQTLIALPQVLISTVGAYKSKDSFRKEIVTWQNVSILFSFLAMAKTFHRIRNLSKQNALSGKAAIVSFLLTTFETTARILAFGLFLYLYSQNLDAMAAVVMYYGHVLVMVFFNFILNKQKPTCSVAYLLGLLLNSLNCVFTYNNYQYEKILGQKKSKKELHQPSLLRQVTFYSIFLMENLALTICSCIFFDEKKQREGSVHVADGYGGKFEMSRGNLQSTVVFIWVCQIIAGIMRFFYYSLHPADVSIKDFKAKNQVNFQVSLVNDFFCSLFMSCCF